VAKPTLEQIQAEIEQLTAMCPKVRHYSAFGDDNRAAISAQIAVLEKLLDNDAIFDRYEQGSDEAILYAALDARQWLDGDFEDDTLSEGWQELVQD